LNQKDTIISRRETLRQYHLRGGHEMARLQPLHLWSEGSKEHEFAKCGVAYALHRLGKQFILEAVNNETDERADVVCLDDGHIFEVETDPKRAERFKGRDDVTVVTITGLNLEDSILEGIATVENYYGELVKEK
jgi:hypothetical protein